MSAAATRAVTLAVGSVRLRVALRGAGPDVLLLHGFTGSSRSMEGVARGLSARFRILAPDLIGHGESDAPRDPAPYALGRCVAQLAGVLDALARGRVHLLGYSMGGRIALALAAAHPERVASALVLGASAGLEDAGARAARRREDEALAARIERGGLAAFVDAWMAQPLLASQRHRLAPEALARARAERLAQRAHGLAHALRGLGLGAQPPLAAELARAGVPLCLVAGEEDAKFRARAADLAARVAHARIETIPGAGHAAHLEQPAAFLRVATAFFERPGRGATWAPRAAVNQETPREVSP